MIAYMPRTPNEKPDAAETGTTPFQIRLPNVMRTRLIKLAKSKSTDLSEEVRSAIRKHLQDAGLWPEHESK